MGYAHLSKEDIWFITDVEKKVHKMISAMRYGQKIEINLDIAETKEELARAIKKSARYNCMDIRTQWPKQNGQGSVTISVE